MPLFQMSGSNSSVKEAKAAYESGDYTRAGDLFQAEADKGDPEAITTWQAFTIKVMALRRTV